MALTNEEILDAIASKTVLEISELIKMMEEKFGVTATAAVAVAGPAAGAAAAPAEEKSEFDVVLAAVGSSDRPRLEGSQGPRRRRPQGHQGRRCQGRSRRTQEEDRSFRRQGRTQVIFPFGKHLKAVACRGRPLWHSLGAAKKIGESFRSFPLILK